LPIVLTDSWHNTKSTGNKSKSRQVESCQPKQLLHRKGHNQQSQKLASHMKEIIFKLCLIRASSPKYTKTPIVQQECKHYLRNGQRTF
jgi:hypothetical protein